jgi:hypothetical protein
VKERVHGVTLEAADFDGQLVVAMVNARAFTENIDGTYTGAAGAEDVGVENGERGATQIALRDFFDETRNINVRRAGGDAGRVETVKAAVGFGEGGLLVEGRMEIGKASDQF